MLHFETVYPETLKLLKELTEIESLKEFSLAGGTALSLYFGHRISIDIDLFIDVEYSTDEVMSDVLIHFKDKVQIINKARNSLQLTIQNIKVDILAHRFEMLSSPIIKSDIKIYSKADIIAMKLNAVANRGAKKDFFDIYEALKVFSLEEMLSFFETKYKNVDSFFVLRALIYFVDADKQPEPIMLYDYNWDDVKQKLKNEVRIYQDRL